MSTSLLRSIAFYLPQFHPIPENDQWWGAGFTEWTSVAAAKPLFDGHVQPKIPGELGFYDLRVSESRAEQADLASAHGVDAFCYWHYWFAGRRLLERPAQEVLASGEPDFPYCFGWANADWTSVWVGKSREMLVEQTYPGRDDWIAHFDALAPHFADERYVKVDGRPLLYIYRPADVVRPQLMREVWDQRADQLGLGRPYLVGEVDLATSDGRRVANSAEFDGVVDTSWDRAFGRGQKVQRRLPGGPMRRDYRAAAEKINVTPDDLHVPSFPMVLTGWDNTPRFGRRGVVLEDYTPQALQHAVKAALARLPREPAPQFLFVKSWNEWAEGNVLEPERGVGRVFLEAFASALAEHPER